MKTIIIRYVLSCLVISLVGSLGSVGVATLVDFVMWAAFTKELPWIATSWPGLNAWPVLGLLTMQVVSSLLLGIAVAGYAMSWTTGRFPAER